MQLLILSRSALTAALVLAAAAATALALIASPAAGQTTVTYTVTVENLTGGQPFTPPVVAIHSSDVSLFEMGEAASPQVQAIAENGNNEPMLTFLNGSAAVDSVAAGAAPVLPGESAVITIEGPSGGLISAVMMLICTNDGFTGIDAVALPASGSEEIEAKGYDAGTENNTEDFADIVPPCQPLTGVTSSEEGTAETNPDLAEGGVITAHAGIQGDADLTIPVHGWTGPTARITVSAGPAQLPDTGGAPLDSGTGADWTLYAAIGGALLIAAGGIYFVASRRMTR